MLKIKDKDGKVKFILDDEDEEPQEVEEITIQDDDEGDEDAKNS